MKYLALLLLIVFECNSATIIANSGSQADFDSAVSAASNGDTIHIPADIENWTNTTTISKALTIRGAGVGQTIIGYGHITPSSPIIIWNLQANLPHRITGLEFQTNAAADFAYNGCIQINGRTNPADTASFRMDNCRFTNLLGVAVIFQNIHSNSVVDHIYYTGIPTARFANVFNPNWIGANYGDGSWVDDDHFGKGRCIVFEDSVFVYPTSGSAYAFIDAWNGGRFVFRNNILTNGWVEAHGTDSGNRLRGTRTIEMYSNRMYGNDVNAYLGNFRSGVSIVYSNEASAYTASPRYELAAYRVDTSYAPWGIADGSNEWDTNNVGTLIKALDQPGRSGGSLISGDTPTHLWSNGQNDQTNNACYEWDNTEDGGDVDFIAGHSVIVENVNYVQDTARPNYVAYQYPHPLNVADSSLSPGRRKPRVGKKDAAIIGPWFSIPASVDLSDFTFQLSSK